MKTSVLLAACGVFLVAALPAFAQNAAPGPTAVYPDSPARANPHPGNSKRPGGTDDGKRGPRGPLDWERTVALSPDGQAFVTLNLDGRMRLWHTVTGHSDVELPAGVAGVAFSPDGRLLACRFDRAGANTGGRQWQVLNTADGQAAAPPCGAGEAVGELPEAVIFSPDGKRLAGLAAAGADTRVAWWNVDDAKVMASPPVKDLSAAGALAFSPDGKKLAAFGAGGTIVLLDFTDAKALRFLPTGPVALGTAVFSPDGRLLAVGGAEKRTVKGHADNYPVAALYDVASGKMAAELKLIPTANAQVRQIVFADGGRAVVAATDVNSQAFSPLDGRLLANLPEAGFPLALSPDGKTLAGSQYPDLRIWDTAAWRLGMKIANARVGDNPGSGHSGEVSLAFTADGEGLIALRINSVGGWEMPGGRPVIEHDATQSRVFN